MNQDSDIILPTNVSHAPTLLGNTLKLQHAIAMSIAAMSPVGSIFVNTIPQAGLVGAAIPLCYVIGFGIALLIAYQISLMAAEFPSSGSLYTFVTQGLGVRWGFLVGWFSLISFGLSIPLIVVLMSAVLQDLFFHWFGAHIDWAIWYGIFSTIIFAVCYRGIRFSLQLDFTLLMFEIGVCLLLALIVLVQAGKAGQLTIIPFTLQKVPPNSNLVVGIVLSILSFVGFESATTLGEEVQKPRQTIPKAITISLILVGVFYILMAYVATIGYGINQMASFAKDTVPFDTIARRVWGNGLALLIDLAGIIAGYACAVAFLNGSARIVYAMSRERLFPAWFDRVHPKYRTPVSAIGGLSVMSLIVGLGLGMLWTPIVTYTFLGTLLTLAALIIYGLVSLACWRYFSIKCRTGRSLHHHVLPWLSIIVILGILVGTVYPPPPAPLNLAPYIFLVWLLLGMIVFWFVNKKHIQKI